MIEFGISSACFYPLETEKALELLGGKVVKSIRFDLPNNYGERHLVIIEKIKPTPSIYPRDKNQPKTNPIK